MAMFTDGRSIVNIDLRQITESGKMSPDFSEEFYGIVPGDAKDKNGAYIVPDLWHIVERATDWRACIGRFFYNDYLPGGMKRYIKIEWY